jgi:hypothetical protein
MKNRLVLETDDPDEIFYKYKYAISRALIKGIEWSLRYKKNNVTFVEIYVNDMIVIDLTLYEEDFMDALNANLETLIECEDYETCALVIKLKNKLNEKVIKKAGTLV